LPNTHVAKLVRSARLGIAIMDQMKMCRNTIVLATLMALLVAWSQSPEAMLEMSCNKHQTIVGTIVTDDDSSIKAKLKRSNADHMTNNNTTDIPKITNRVGNILTLTREAYPATCLNQAFLQIQITDTRRSRMSYML